MPSSYYSVSISTLTGPGSTGDGFIDNTPVANYLLADLDAIPSVALYTRKARANIRYKLMVQQLQLMANCNLYNVVATGASEIASPNPFAFTINVDRGQEVVTTPDELNLGVSLVGAAAIQRCIARSFIQTNTTLMNLGGTSTLVTSGPPIDTSGSLTNSLVTLAAAAITVTLLYVPDSNPNVYESETSVYGEGGGGAE